MCPIYKLRPLRGWAPGRRAALAQLASSPQDRFPGREIDVCSAQPTRPQTRPGKAWFFFVWRGFLGVFREGWHRDTRERLLWLSEAVSRAWEGCFFTPGAPYAPRCDRSERYRNVIHPDTEPGRHGIAVPDVREWHGLRETCTEDAERIHCL
jgi:hypothetical protein